MKRNSSPPQRTMLLKDENDTALILMEKIEKLRAQEHYCLMSKRWVGSKIA